MVGYSDLHYVFSFVTFTINRACTLLMHAFFNYLKHFFQIFDQKCAAEFLKMAENMRSFSVVKTKIRAVHFNNNFEISSREISGRGQTKK